MRNTVQYPITYAEKIDLISRLYEDSCHDTNNFGSMKTAILLEIKRDLYRLAARDEDIAEGQ